jgi:hypothetical protein
MKITELKIPDNKREAEYALEDAGYKALGAGSFGSVYKKPGSNYVLKLFESDDNGYITYLNMIKNHQNNPHFPKIRGNLVKVTKDFYAVRMEELSESPMLNREIELITVFCKRRADFWEGDWDKFMKQNFGPDARNGLNVLFQENPKLSEALVLIAELQAKHKLWFDFKRANIMSRSGLMVITDPLV